MKKYIAVMAGAAALLAVSCARESENAGGLAPGNIPSAGEKVVLTVDLDGVRSAYIPGTGVALDGTEKAAVYYSDPGNHKLGGPLEAVPVGEGVYEFTVPGGVQYEPMWYALMPYSAAMTSAGKDARTAVGTISTVQFPKAGSFDPAYDYLAAEGFEISDGEATINRFRRVTAPLKVTVTGLPAGATIFTATMTIGQKAVPASCRGLVGEANIYMTDNYRKSSLTYLENAGYGVSALYREGLAEDAGTWPVWFSVNPAELSQGSSFTFTVSTANLTFTKSAVVPVECAIERNQLNELEVDFTGVDGVESATMDLSTDAVYQALQTGDEVTVMASDGKEYTLKMSGTGCSVSGTDALPGGIVFSDASMTLPSSDEKDITCVRLFASPALSAADALADISVSAWKKTKQVSSANANLYPFADREDYLNNTGGVASLSIPEVGTYTLGGTSVSSEGGSPVFCAATFLMRDKYTPVYDPNDYVSIYEAGLDFTIGDITVNADEYPDVKILKTSEATAAIFNTSTGIIFLDNSDNTAFEISSNLDIAKGLIVVGRYKNSQPKIVVNGKYVEPKGDNCFKNLHITCSGAGLFTATRAEDGVASFICEDCTLIASGGTLFREANANLRFGDVSLLNCVIQVSTGFMAASSAGKPMLGTEDSFTLENCVITPIPNGQGEVSFLAQNLFTLTEGSEGHTMFYIRNNTVIGFNGPSGGTAMVTCKTIGGFDISNNVFVGNWTAGKTDRLVKTTTPQSFKPEPRIIANNFCSYNGTTAMGTTNGDSQYFWNGNPKNTGEKLGYVSTPENVFTVKGEPFTTADYTNAYFVINTDLVTTGGGATYDTKLWRQWTE